MTLATIKPFEVEDPELDAVVTLLGGAVAGLPDEHDGEPISAYGVGSNCAAAFRNDVFAIRDYCWCGGRVHPEITDWASEDSPYTEMPPSGGDSSGCPVNFEHFASGIRGIWYKHLGRDNEFNREPKPGEALQILLECLASIGKGHPQNTPRSTNARS